MVQSFLVLHKARRCIFYRKSKNALCECQNFGSYYYYYAAFNAPCVDHKDDELQARLSHYLSCVRCRSGQKRFQQSFEGRDTVS